MKRSKKLPRGIRQRADGSYQAHKMIAGVRVWESFPAGTPESTMVKWREAQKKPTPAVAVAAPAAGSFAAAIVDYGRRRAAIRTIGEMVRTLEKWAHALGRDRDPNTITPAEIETQLQTWQLAGLQPATARNYVVRLQAFFKHRNGEAGPNPARLATKPPRPKYDAPRAIPYETVARILALMCPRRQAGGPALTAIRARVIAYTGIPPGVLAALRITAFDFAGAVVHLPPRVKGAGVEARSVPLTEQGIEACRAFIAANAFGPFNAKPINRAFKRAAIKAGLVDEHGRASVHLYDLRHSFGTMLYAVTHDTATVGRFLGHAKGSTLTLRYTLGAHGDVDRAAARLVSQRLSAAISVDQRRRAGIA